MRGVQLSGCGGKENTLHYNHRSTSNVATTWSGTLCRTSLLYRSGKAVADSSTHTITEQRGAEPATALPERLADWVYHSVSLHVVATVLRKKP